MSTKQVRRSGFKSLEEFLRFGNFELLPTLTRLILGSGQRWILFTPTYSTTVGDGSLGNGTYFGAYRLAANEVHFRLLLNKGGTTAVGTGNVILPTVEGLTFDPDKLPGDT